MKRTLSLALLLIATSVSAQVTTTQKYRVPGSDSWDVKLGLSGITSWWGPNSYTSIPWADALDRITWGVNFYPTSILLHQTSMALTGPSVGGSVIGTVNLDLSYAGTRTGQFRSFFGVYGEAVAYAKGSASADNGLKHPQVSSLGIASSSGYRVFEVSGTSKVISFSLSAIANAWSQVYPVDGALASGGFQLRGLAHPRVSIGLQDHSYKKGANGQRVRIDRDGFGRLEMHVGVKWNTFAQEWSFESFKMSSQELYSNGRWNHTGQGLLTSATSDGPVRAYLGADVTSATLGKSATLSSKLTDISDSSNPTVTIENKLTFHKPLENPERVGTPKAFLKQCSGIEVSDIHLPSSVSNDIMAKVKFNTPGASFLADSTVQSVIDLGWGGLKDQIPYIGKFLPGVPWESIEGTAAVRQVSTQYIFDERWPSSEDPNGGQRWGFGIELGEEDKEDYRFLGVAEVYQSFLTQDWKCDAYGANGYVGIGKVTTFKPRTEEFKIRGSFQKYNDNGGDVPGHGGTPGDHNGVIRPGGR